MLATAAGAGLLGIWIARRLDRGYVVALERSLRDRAVELNLDDVQDHTTRTILMRTAAELRANPRKDVERREEASAAPADPFLQRIMDLRSGDAVRVHRALDEEPLSAPLAAPVIPLLAWDEVAGHAMQALRRAGPGITGQLIDAMFARGQDFAVRRRIPRVLAEFPSPRVMEALLSGLNDKRFEVRFRCGRALASVLGKEAGLSPESDRVWQAVSRELEQGKRLWESYRLLDGGEEDELLRDRANRGLEHVFTLLSLILPKEPLGISFQALHTGDEMLRGTALEYLESVLPPPIRERLWPFLEDRRAPRRAERSSEEILAELLHSYESIQLKLQELKARKTHQA
jgi:hypothetical protein